MHHNATVVSRILSDESSQCEPSCKQVCKYRGGVTCITYSIALRHLVIHNTCAIQNVYEFDFVPKEKKDENLCVDVAHVASKIVNFSENLNSYQFKKSL